MPLVAQQEIVTATAMGVDLARQELLTQLKGYPPVRIVSISITALSPGGRTMLVAVIETL